MNPPAPHTSARFTSCLQNRGSASSVLRARPGHFVAGEMLDWEAPTGGYLLTASIASGWVAGQGAVEWLRQR